MNTLYDCVRFFYYKKNNLPKYSKITCFSFVKSSHTFDTNIIIFLPDRKQFRHVKMESKWVTIKYIL